MSHKYYKIQGLGICKSYTQEFIRVMQGLHLYFFYKRGKIMIDICLLLIIYVYYPVFFGCQLRFYKIKQQKHFEYFRYVKYPAIFQQYIFTSSKFLGHKLFNFQNLNKLLIKRSNLTIILLEWLTQKYNIYKEHFKNT